jgi:hypothetical protein
MAHLVHLAGPGAGGLVIAAPFILIVLLHRLCAFWRDWATTRTHAAYQAALRTKFAGIAHLAQDDTFRAPIPPSAPALDTPTSPPRIDE